MMFPKGAYNRKKRYRARKSYTPEAQIQMMCEQYLDQMCMHYIRIPDALNKAIFGLDSRIPIQIRVLIASFTKGVPDLTILGKDGRYLCVELKTEIGLLSQAQKRWKIGIDEHYHVVRSFEEFRKLIDDWRKNDISNN